MQELIVAGVVLYNPDIKRLRENISAVFQQVEEIYFVDNASDNYTEIEILLNEFPKCSIIRNTVNAGIAKALNQLMECAKKNGYSWILTLDQDSVCEKNMIERMLPYIQDKKCAIICPVAIDDKVVFSTKSETNSIEYVESCITAGSLTNVEVWDKIGHFDDKMFIDFVDIEYCLRIKEKGYSICRVNNTYIHQEYGNISGGFTLFGIKFYLFNYSPVRVYYSVRNQLYLMRKHRKRISICKRSLFLIGYIGKRIVFEKRRKESIKSVIRGIKDGIKMSV